MGLINIGAAAYSRQIEFLPWQRMENAFQQALNIPYTREIQVTSGSRIIPYYTLEQGTVCEKL